MSEGILIVENLTKEYKNIKALDNVNISLERYMELLVKMVLEKLH